MPSILAQESEEANDLSDFEESQEYIVRTCLQKKKKKIKMVLLFQ